MHWFTKLYAGAGLGFLALIALGEWSGALSPHFGSRSVDTSSRQGYWYTYRRSDYSAGPGRSPGGYGGSSGSGGYHGGK